MKKCLVMTLLLTSFAAHAAFVVDVTVIRPGQATVTKTCALNEVAQFDADGVTASLVATEKEGTVFLAAQCSRITETGETRTGEISDVPLTLDTVLTLVELEQVTVTVVARNTEDVKAVCDTAETTPAPATTTATE